ncbi:hypothetical protein CLU79DRAFT_742301 [Phycomyces nitens]|nr:hypothetical protein CLU79DRAFT_742301 [Phycomyces nitens]
MKSFLVAALCFLSAMVVAQDSDFYITAPLPGTVYKAGQSATLKWLNGVDTKVTVNLLVGNDPATMVNSAYSFTIPDGSDEEYTVVIPPNLDSTKSYAFQFSYLSGGTTKNVFSGSFIVTGGVLPTISDAASRSPSLAPSSLWPTAISKSSAAPSVAPSVASSAVSRASSSPLPTIPVKAASSVSASPSASVPAEGSGSKMQYTFVLACAPVILAVFL